MKVHEAFERYFHILRASGRFQPQKLYDALEPSFLENGFRERSEQVTDILIICLGVMGDLILTSGVFREVRRNYPDAHITAIVNDAVLALMKFCPYCDEVFVFDRWALQKSVSECFERMEPLCETSLRCRKFDRCLLPQWGDDKRTSVLLAYMSGARERIGYSDTSIRAYVKCDTIDTSFEAAFLTRTITNPPEIVHEAARNFYLLESLGMEVKDDSTEIWLEEGTVKAASERLLSLMPDHCLVVVLGIGAGRPERKYPVKQYLEAVKLIAKRYGKDIRFVILGGQSEAADGEYLARNLPEDAVINLVKKTTLCESLAIISLASLYLGNDTGLMHAAAAVGTPIVALYREAVDKENVAPGLVSEYARFAPWKARAIVLRPKHALGECANKMLVYGGCDEPFPHCITQITPAEIAAAFEKIAGGAV